MELLKLRDTLLPLCRRWYPRMAPATITPETKAVATKCTLELDVARDKRRTSCCLISKQTNSADAIRSLVSAFLLRGAPVIDGLVEFTSKRPEALLGKKSIDIAIDSQLIGSQWPIRATRPVLLPSFQPNAGRRFWGSQLELDYRDT